MQIDQALWRNNAWEPHSPGRLGKSAQLVLMFGSPDRLKNREHFDAIKRWYPRAHVMGCSTAGEICGTRVFDDSLVVTAVHFEQATIRGAQASIEPGQSSFDVGARLAQSLKKEGLRHVFVLSDGLKVNGSELVKGLTYHLPPHITVTGGLSGDGDRFQETLVLWDSYPKSHMITILGLYGPGLKIGYGSMGGWDSFGAERLITRSKGNVLFELDGKSALALYEQYLGEHAKGLPSTGLLFPLSIRTGEGGNGVVRTILSVDRKEKSMTFAGDVPEGAYARLMKANFDRLVDGAVGAARTSYTALGESTPELALLISCVGRKHVLKQRVEEEVEGVREVLGQQTIFAGFYSYGEISPFSPSAKCELHNQTMTITTLSER